MLKPFEHAGIGDYLKACMTHVRPLLTATAGVGGFKAGDGSITLTSSEYSQADLDLFARWQLNDSGTQRMRELGLEVTCMRNLVGLDWDILEADPMLNEFYYPRSVHDVIGFSVYWPEDDAFALSEFHHDRFGTPRMGNEGEEILRMLLPSQRAGAKLLYSLGAHRLRLARDLETLGVCLAVCAHDGRIVHAAGSLRRLLASDPDGDDVLRRIPIVAREVVAGLRHRSGSGGALADAHQVMNTRSVTYRLSGALATHDMAFGATDVLVTVSRLTPMPLEASALMKKYGLTAREADVAVHLSRGDRNAAIAKALGLSPHTVRRHTERLLAKLGVENRAAAVAILRA